MESVLNFTRERVLFSPLANILVCCIYSIQGPFTEPENITYENWKSKSKEEMYSFYKKINKNLSLHTDHTKLGHDATPPTDYKFSYSANFIKFSLIREPYIL